MSFRACSLYKITQKLLFIFNAYKSFSLKAFKGFHIAPLSIKYFPKLGFLKKKQKRLYLLKIFDSSYLYKITKKVLFILLRTSNSYSLDENNSKRHLSALKTTKAPLLQNNAHISSALCWRPLKALFSIKRIVKRSDFNKPSLLKYHRKALLFSSLYSIPIKSLLSVGDLGKIFFSIKRIVKSYTF